MHFKLFGRKIEIDTAFIEKDEAEVREQLEKYIRGEIAEFKLDIRFPDDFTGRVMREMSEIPYGETRTYGEIAEKLDTSAIAIGQTCGRNPVPVIIPCHRVVGKDSIGGYMYGQELKQKLLDHESEN